MSHQTFEVEIRNINTNILKNAYMYKRDPNFNRFVTTHFAYATHMGGATIETGETLSTILQRWSDRGQNISSTYCTLDKK